MEFVTHDGIYMVLDRIGLEGRHCEHLDCIEIMDGCFIGLRSTILPGVRIGPRAIVGAGSVVTKDVPEGAVVAGNPARVIGRFEDVVKKQAIESAAVEFDDRFDPRRIAQAWALFDEKHAPKQEQEGEKHGDKDSSGHSGDNDMREDTVHCGESGAEHNLAGTPGAGDTAAG